MSKKVIKIWLIIILAAAILAGVKYILSQNLKDEALFDIDTEKVECIELYKAGSEFLTADDEKQSEIIQLLNSVQWKSRAKNSSSGGPEYHMHIHYKDKQYDENNYEIFDHFVFDADEIHTGGYEYTLKENYLKDLTAYMDEMCAISD